MKIQAFVFNWKGHEERAARLEESIAPFAEVVVINSEEGLAQLHPRWIHLDDAAYFSAQWNAALDRFDGDVLFHVQADAVVDDLSRLFDRARAAFAMHPLGVFEPRIENCTEYDRTLLRHLGNEVYEVPTSDSTCWFVAGPVLRRFPTIDVQVNKYGWGIPVTVAALARRMGRICVRDYSVTVQHAKGRGYSTEVAFDQRVEYLNRLDVDLACAMVLVYLDIKKLRSRE
jgi:hypothetical protein